MRMSRVVLSLAIGALLSIPILSEPAAAAEPSALLTSSVGYSAEKAVTTVQTTSTAEKASHATASASAERCSTGIYVIALDLATPTFSVALEVGHAGLVLGLRDPGDEDDGAGQGSEHAGLVASIPGDNEPAGEGDHEPPQAA